MAVRYEHRDRRKRQRFRVRFHKLQSRLGQIENLFRHTDGISTGKGRPSHPYNRYRTGDLTVTTVTTVTIHDQQGVGR